MNEVSYSHELVWEVINYFPDMDYTRLNNPLKWKLFTTAVGQETANAYPDNTSTSIIINKMADDLGSYVQLMNIWFGVEQVLENNCNSDFES